jgi:hypothetical protein
MRLVSIGEVAARKNPDSAFAQATPGQLDNAAKKLREVGPDLDRAINEEAHKAGIPGALMMMVNNPPSDEPWLAAMPGDMMANYAMMLEAAADAKREEKKEKERAEAEAKTNPLAAAAEQTRIVGNETVIDRPAIHLVADDLNHTQGANGQQFTMNTMHLWVDAEHYVPLKMQIDGVATEGGESRALRIEREDMAYRSVAGCGSMYEPQRTVMRMSGILSAEEQAQLVEAQAQLAEFETQLASMPASQRDMIMRQMGPQMEMLKSMAAGQGIEVVSLVVGMRCNGGLPSDEEYMQTAPGISAGACIGFGN